MNAPGMNGENIPSRRSHSKNDKYKEGDLVGNASKKNTASRVSPMNFQPQP